MENLEEVRPFPIWSWHGVRSGLTDFSTPPLRGGQQSQLVKYHNRKASIKVKDEMRDAIVEMIQGDNSVAAVC